MKACPVGPCDVPIAPDKTMCRKHWMMLPAERRAMVERAKHAHEARPLDVGRRDRYREAQKAAIEAVTALGATRTAR